MGNQHMKIDKYLLNLAGEYRVCSELLKRGIFATVTYGNKKCADIYAIGPNRKAVTIEVKSSNGKKFVTGFYQKYKKEDMDHPAFWVLYSAGQEEFFVLRHKELARIQAKRNGRLEERKNLGYDKYAALFAHGVDNVLISHVKRHESAWHKITKYCGIIHDPRLDVTSS